MMGMGQCCCIANDPFYTTRQYDLSGHVIWSQDFFQSSSGSGGLLTTCQTVDSGTVYVGGQRTTVGGVSYSLMALDITTGLILWTYDFGSGLYPVQLRIDNGGDIACMLNSGWDPAHPATACTQTFVLLNAIGVLQNSGSFTQVTSTGLLVTQTVDGLFNTVDFVINQNGDYHIVGFSATTTGTGFEGAAKGGIGIYEWTTPFSGSPTLYTIQPDLQRATMFKGLGDLDGTGCIVRANGRDYIGSRWGWVRGKVMARAPQTNADFDLASNPIPSYGYPSSPGTGIIPTVPLGIGANGTSQASAIAGATSTINLSNNNNVSTFHSGGTTHTAIVLPASAPAGSFAEVFPALPISTSNPAFIVFPPVGGRIYDINSQYPINSSYTPPYPFSAPNDQFGDLLISDATGLNWIALRTSADAAPGHNSAWGNLQSQRLFVDASDNVYAGFNIDLSPADGYRDTTKVWDSSATLQWISGHGSINVVADLSGNVYTACDTSGAGISLTKRNSSGAWQWGHSHATAQPIQQSSIDYDSTGTTLIVTGQWKNSAFDSSFVSNPW